MHLCLTMECITSGLHLSVFLIRSPPPPPLITRPAQEAAKSMVRDTCALKVTGNWTPRDKWLDEWLALAVWYWFAGLGVRYGRVLHFFGD